jgi:hypothetical protein
VIPRVLLHLRNRAGRVRADVAGAFVVRMAERYDLAIIGDRYLRLV